tara:strand:- start:383 stop:583 length:201 start_codon:yes stop_codon:yes gene_type:complete
MKKYAYCLMNMDSNIMFSCYTLKAMDKYIEDYGPYYDYHIEVMERGVLETIRLCDAMYGHKSLDRL